ncbi:MAG: transposase [Prevotellaceae bacterium]|jgi:hypothetical protein|nr:transposase [Prevotellaceae bacterium]
MSYTKLLYHVVFRTKHGKNTIPEQHEKELYAYIKGIVENKKSKLHNFRTGRKSTIIFQILNGNKGVGLLFETEGDTMVFISLFERIYRGKV